MSIAGSILFLIVGVIVGASIIVLWSIAIAKQRRSVHKGIRRALEEGEKRRDRSNRKLDLDKRERGAE